MVAGWFDFLMWFELMDEQEMWGQSVDGVTMWCGWRQMMRSLIARVSVWVRSFFDEWKCRPG